MKRNKWNNIINVVYCEWCGARIEVRQDWKNRHRLDPRWFTYTTNGIYRVCDKCHYKMSKNDTLD